MSPPSRNNSGRTPGPSQRFKTTREAHAEETAEDYVEGVAELIERHGEARVVELARMMGVSHVTVSRIISRLVKQGLVTTAPYKPIELTPAGNQMARRARERHEIVLSFLRTIGVPERQAEIDAEGIEHHVSQATIRAMRDVVRRAVR